MHTGDGIVSMEEFLTFRRAAVDATRLLPPVALQTFRSVEKQVLSELLPHSPSSWWR